MKEPAIAGLRTLRVPALLLGISFAAGVFPAAASCPLAAVAGGGGHTLGLTPEGTLLAWGMNAYGELGLGFTSFAAEEPRPVPGLDAVIAIAAGEHFSLALRNDGVVWAWGENSFGALGDGTLADSPAPAPVAGLTGVIAIAAGSHHAVALRGDGSVWGWGGTWAGQIGDPALVYVTTPAPLWGMSSIRQVAAGGTSTLVIDDSASVFAFGRLAGPNGLGPALIAGLDNIVAIAAGGDRFGQDHGLALHGDGRLSVWGMNSHGQLGDGATSTRESPVQIPSLSGVQAIAAGSYHSVALLADTTLLAWGRNDMGQLGTGSFDSSSVPVAVAGSADVARISAGGMHTLALSSGGTAVSWGWGGTGQLGRLAGIASDTPQVVAGFAPASVVAASTRGDSSVWVGADPLEGRDHTLVLRTDGSIWAFGSNRFGQLGDGTTRDSASARLVPVIEQAVAVAAGGRHSLAIRDDGSVWAWGANAEGQLGDGSTTARPLAVPVSGLSGAIAIAAGDRDSLALLDDGTVWAWGWFAGSSTPRPVNGLAGSFLAIAAGSKFYLALRDDATLWAWGWNERGQLGNGSDLPVFDQPVQVAIDGVRRIAAGGAHALALRQDGTLWSWGANNEGQLGDGSTLGRNLPARIPSLSNVASIAAGADHSLAGVLYGPVWTWGRNFFGEAGTGRTGGTARKLLPEEVPGLARILKLEAGGSSSLALGGEGALSTWGWNGVGQLGDGAVNRASLPGVVLTDRPAPAQGNLLHLARLGTDILFEFGQGSAAAYALYRDPDKTSLGRNALASPLVATRHLEDGAMLRPANDFYSLRGLSACTLSPE